MAWDDDLSLEQGDAASHEGSHARLLAGPGTGKTRVLTGRVRWLIEEQGISASSILVLTFTRAAAAELRNRIAEVFPEDSDLPNVSTLHSFCLRQLLRNLSSISTLPDLVRIADDWEERNIIEEELKCILGLNIPEVREKIMGLASDWQTLDADHENWDEREADPAFLGAWQEHRGIYGYIMRSELVYQLKRALEQQDDIELEPISHLLVDEYQDLNRCDLAIIQALVQTGAELYVAGDDDQSIYGFRKAHPEGIRRFTQDYNPSTGLGLQECRRCDSSILELGLFVAEGDPRRLEKPIHAEGGRPEGTVKILRFGDQGEEANGIASIIDALHDQEDYDYGDILILIRGDRNNVFSSVIRKALEDNDIPVAAITSNQGPLDSDQARRLYAILRLMVNPDDSLAYRTLLEFRSGIGKATIRPIYEFARNNRLSFVDSLRAIAEDPALAGRGRMISLAFNEISNLLANHSEQVAAALQECEDATEDELIFLITQLTEELIPDEEEKQAVLGYLSDITNRGEITCLKDLVHAIEVSSEDIEQELDEDKVNILTMHKAKGLTAEVVFVVACEDETIPGNGDVDEERRLLFVSLTRARHGLFITYCNQRHGQQSHTGRGGQRRNLSRFLSVCPLAPERGMDYVNELYDHGN